MRERRAIRGRPSCAGFALTQRGLCLSGETQVTPLTHAAVHAGRWVGPAGRRERGRHRRVAVASGAALPDPPTRASHRLP